MWDTLSGSPSDTTSNPSGEALSAMWSLMLSDALDRLPQFVRPDDDLRGQIEARDLRIAHPRGVHEGHPPGRVPDRHHEAVLVLVVSQGDRLAGLRQSQDLLHLVHVDPELAFVRFVGFKSTAVQGEIDHRDVSRVDRRDSQ